MRNGGTERPCVSSHFLPLIFPSARRQVVVLATHTAERNPVSLAHIRSGWTVVIVDVPGGVPTGLDQPCAPSRSHPRTAPSARAGRMTAARRCWSRSAVRRSWSRRRPLLRRTSSSGTPSSGSRDRAAHSWPTAVPSRPSCWLASLSVRQWYALPGEGGCLLQSPSGDTSTMVGGTRSCRAAWSARHPVKVEVAGSNPVRTAGDATSVPVGWQATVR